MKLDILAFGAHPDDVELSAAGTVLKHVKLGKKVGIIDLTRGELGTRGTPVIRAKEAAASARILGVAFRENMKMADGFFRNDKKHQMAIIKKIRQYQPDVVLANAIEDRHPDHGRAAKLIADACFLAGLSKISTVVNGKKQKPWRIKALYHYIQYRKLKADFAVDVTGFMDKKMEAIRAFGSQFYNPASKEPSTLISSPHFLDYVKAREAEYGQMVNAGFAEGYNVMEEYRGPVLI